MRLLQLEPWLEHEIVATGALWNMRLLQLADVHLPNLLHHSTYEPAT